MHLRYEIIFYKDIVATEFFMNISVLPVKNLFFPLHEYVFNTLVVVDVKLRHFPYFM